MKKNSRILSFLLLMAIILTTVFSIGATASAATLPGFYVQGRYLYDYLGNKTTLIGANAMLIYWDGTGTQSYPNLANTGANAVRIFWNVDSNIPTSQFDTAMQNAINNELIPIPSVWNATGDWSQLDTCVNWWLRSDVLAVVKKYEKYMILNIANEAGDGSVTKDAWETKYKEVITRFRNAGVHCPLMIDTGNWGRDESYALERGQSLVTYDPDHNLIFDWHPWDENQPRTRYHNALTSAISQNLCLFVGEFAHVGVFYDQPIDWQGLVEECIEHDTGWMPWSWRGASATDGHNMTNDYVNLTTWGSSIVPYITNNAVPSPIFGGDPGVIGNGTGLRGEYFDNMDLTVSKLARTDSMVNFDWGTGTPDTAVGADTFSTRWTGQVQPKYSGTYTFYTNTDDGVKLWVNNQLLINKWVDQGPTEWSGTISLTAGQKYDIKMEYYENSGGAVAKLLWSSSSQTKQVIPQTQLYPAADPNPSPDTLEIDYFEGYASDAALQSVYPRVDHGNTVTVYRDTANKNDGSYGMRYAYTIGTPNYAGVRRTLNNSNWSGYDGIQFWLKPDGSGRTLTIQFKESSNEFWETTYTLSGTTAGIVQLPFADFANPSWGGGVNGIIELGSIAELSIYVNQGSGSTGSSTIYFDSMAAYKGGTAGTSYSEDFNDNLAQGWTISPMFSVTNGKLDGGDWSSLQINTYDGTIWSGDYTYKVDFSTGGAGSDYNSTRVIFNYTNSSNYYFVSFGNSSTAGAVALEKVVNGTTTTIASYGNYVVAGKPTTVEIIYVNGGDITVKATQNSVTTTLFNNVRDTSLTSGKIGAGTRNTFTNFDNVSVVQ